MITGILQGYTVVSATVDFPTVETQEIGSGRSIRVGVGDPLMEVTVQVPLSEAERVDLMKRYTDNERITFAGHEMWIKEPGWHAMNTDEPYMEFTLRGKIPAEKVAALQKVIQHNSGGAAALREAGKKVEARQVEENTRLGTLDELVG